MTDGQLSKAFADRREPHWADSKDCLNIVSREEFFARPKGGLPPPRPAQLVRREPAIEEMPVKKCCCGQPATVRDSCRPCWSAKMKASWAKRKAAEAPARDAAAPPAAAEKVLPPPDAMTAPARPAPRLRLSFETTPQVIAALAHLVNTGFYGFSIEDAAERFLSAALEVNTAGWRSGSALGS